MNRRRTIEIAVDFHGMFASVDDAMAHCAGLEDLPILFIEDPFQSLSARDVPIPTIRISTFANVLQPSTATARSQPLMNPCQSGATVRLSDN